MTFRSFCIRPCVRSFSFFFFNDTATTEIYTLSLHDALPISTTHPAFAEPSAGKLDYRGAQRRSHDERRSKERSEEHTSELQSHSDLVCRLLLEKKTRVLVMTDRRFAPCPLELPNVIQERSRI